MKKTIYLVMLSLAIFSCQKDDLIDNEMKDEATTTTLKSTTVTTESQLKSAINNASAGDKIIVSGTIKLSSTLKCKKSGSSSNKIEFTGGTIDCSNLSSGSRGVDLQGSYWYVHDMTIQNAPDNGLLIQKGGNHTIYKVKTSGNGDTGIQIYNGAHDVYVSYCTSWDNYDEDNGGENADGFACKLSGGKNVKFYKCNAVHNSDDGWDLYEQPYTVVIDNCLAEKNGYGTNGDGNGFKLGSSGQDVDHTVTYCTANNNLGNGYDGNGNTGHITITGSTGSGNGKKLFSRIY